MSLVLQEIENFCNYRGVTVCVLGDIFNWRKVAKQNKVIADNQYELVAWFVYHKKNLKVFKGNHLILYSE